MTRLADAERELALHYAPRGSRAVLRGFWALDERLAAIVADTGEAMIGEMRLFWWREALESLAQRVPAEPLLTDIARLLGDEKRVAAEWGAIAEGWHALLQQPLETEELERFASERGGRLFAVSADILGESIEGLKRAGAGWALCDLAAHSSSQELADTARGLARGYLDQLSVTSWPVALRPLGALTVLARHDVQRVRIARTGSPRRVARMAWHRLTGR